MIGLKGDDLSTIEDTFRFAKKVYANEVFFQQAVPFPGTAFYQWVKDEGYLKTEDYSKWLNQDGYLDCLVNYPYANAKEIRETAGSFDEPLLLLVYLYFQNVPCQPKLGGIQKSNESRIYLYRFPNQKNRKVGGEKMDALFLRIYHKLPRPFQYWISRIKYKPELGKGVTLLGWSTFSQNVSIGDYSYMKQNDFMSNVSIGKFCCIADGLVVGLNERPPHEFSSYRMNGINAPLRKRIPTGGGIPPHTTIGNDVWIGWGVFN